MKIQELGRSDLLDMYHMCWSGDSWAEYFYKLRKESHEAYNHVYAAYFEGKIVATVRVKESGTLIREAIKNECIYIEDLRVLKKYRRRGYATALIRYVLFTFKKKGYKSATLGVEVDNEPAYNLYKKLGFNKVYYDMRGYDLLKKEL